MILYVPVSSRLRVKRTNKGCAYFGSLRPISSESFFKFVSWFGSKMRDNLVGYNSSKINLKIYRKWLPSQLFPQHPEFRLHKRPPLDFQGFLESRIQLLRSKHFLLSNEKCLQFDPKNIKLQWPQINMTKHFTLKYIHPCSSMTKTSPDLKQESPFFQTSVKTFLFVSPFLFT